MPQSPVQLQLPNGSTLLFPNPAAAQSFVDKVIQQNKDKVNTLLQMIKDQKADGEKGISDATVGQIGGAIANITHQIATSALDIAAETGIPAATAVNNGFDTIDAGIHIAAGNHAEGIAQSLDALSTQLPGKWGSGAGVASNLIDLVQNSSDAGAATTGPGAAGSLTQVAGDIIDIVAKDGLKDPIKPLTDLAGAFFKEDEAIRNLVNVKNSLAQSIEQQHENALRVIHQLNQNTAFLRNQLGGIGSGTTIIAMEQESEELADQADRHSDQAQAAARQAQTAARRAAAIAARISAMTTRYA